MSVPLKPLFPLVAGIGVPVSHPPPPVPSTPTTPEEDGPESQPLLYVLTVQWGWDDKVDEGRDPGLVGGLRLPTHPNTETERTVSGSWDGLC